MDNQELLPHLFRTEYRKIVSVLCRYFGPERIQVAEDIAGDTFLTATETWAIKGIPPNPVAWLYHVAKNKTKNYLQRESVFDSKIAGAIRHDTALTEETEIDLSPQNISDSQLRMMFVLCHPANAPEAQVTLCLRILCGFGIEEIADAFLANKESINKRLFRAKEKLREAQLGTDIPAAAEMKERLASVLTTLYLLFNEGYYSVSQNKTLRQELCLEAMRLCHMLTENARTDTPEVNALLALMCFHASRFEARLDHNGGLILYEEQDMALWDSTLITQGNYYLNRSATGDQLSRYHLEAGIACLHTEEKDSPGKWEQILQLYNLLLQTAYSPVAALNRTYALAKANGREQAIAAAEKLKLEDNHFYFTLLGTLYTGLDQARATQHFQKALGLAKTATDRQTIQKKLDQLN
jgi:RNA polymerase sigma factor (sigma-70 family)